MRKKKIVGDTFMQVEKSEIKDILFLGDTNVVFPPQSLFSNPNETCFKHSIYRLFVHRSLMKGHFTIPSRKVTKSNFRY